MGGMMRGKISVAKRVATALAFSLILPFSHGIVNALPGPGSNKPKKEQVEKKKSTDPTSMFASMRVATGSMISSMILKKRFDDLRELHARHTKTAYYGKRDPAKYALNELNREIRIMTEAAKFEEDERRMAAIGSVHIASMHLPKLYQNNKEAIKRYLFVIEQISGAELVGALERWLKNSKEDVVPLYKSLSSCKCIAK